MSPNIMFVIDCQNKVFIFDDDIYKYNTIAKFITSVTMITAKVPLLREPVACVSL